MAHHSVTTRPATASQAGFTMLEVVFANVVMAVAILAYVHCIGTANKVNRATEERATAVVTLGRFVERLRADASWTDLYTRLRALSAESAKDTKLEHLGIDTKLPTRPVTDYYPDFSVPTTLGTVTFLVQVPVMLVGAVPTLCETQVAPRYGLPRDLNGDGAIDSNPRVTDYTALPIVARLRWTRPGEQPHEAVLSTWLRGER